MGGGDVGQIFWKIQNLGNERGVVKNVYVEFMKRTWY